MTPGGHFDRVALIANPVSRKGAVKKARKLQKALLKAGVTEISVNLTAKPGHGRELVVELVKAEPDAVTLIIVVGGDGSLHDVVNGAMDLVDEGFRPPTIAIEPAGNGNDHYRARCGSKFDLVKAILNPVVSQMDLILLTVEGQPRLRRYAASYLSFGRLTTWVAAMLPQIQGWKWIKEKLLAVRSLFHIDPFSLWVGQEDQRLIHLSFHNVWAMAKYFNMAKTADPFDGLIERCVIESGKHRTARVLPVLTRAVTAGLEVEESAPDYSFRWLEGGQIQLDGEIVEAGRHSHVTVQVVRGALPVLADSSQ